MELLAKEQMKLLAPAKINFSLYVDKKREDGYHPISSIMAPIELYDEIILNYEPLDEPLKVNCLVPANKELESRDNLIIKLATAYAAARNIGGHIEITLHKNIPAKAGLGGGSSDGASVLFWLNSRQKEPWDLEKLSLWAAKLSADAPFFFYKSSALVRGIGELIKPINKPLSGYLLLVKPPADYSTKDIYTAFDALKKHPPLPADIKAQQMGHNDLLFPATKFCREIKTALSDLELALAKSYQSAKVLSMSGSGSTCYALLADKAAATMVLNTLERRPGWFYHICQV